MRRGEVRQGVPARHQEEVRQGAPAGGTVDHTHAAAAREVTKSLQLEVKWFPRPRFPPPAWWRML